MQWSKIHSLQLLEPFLWEIYNITTVNLPRCFLLLPCDKYHNCQYHSDDDASNGDDRNGPHIDGNSSICAWSRLISCCWYFTGRGDSNGCWDLEKKWHFYDLSLIEATSQHVIAKKYNRAIIPHCLLFFPWTKIRPLGYLTPPICRGLESMLSKALQEENTCMTTFSWGGRQKEQ